MLNTSCVNAGVPVLLVQFPRDSTGSFPVHLINAKREKCYTLRKYWSFRSWGNIKGYEKEEDASERLLKLGQHKRKSAKQRFCIKTSPFLPALLSSQDDGKLSEWRECLQVNRLLNTNLATEEELGYWIRAWLLGLRPLLPSLGTSSNRSGLFQFLNLIKGCCSTFAKCFE